MPAVYLDAEPFALEGARKEFERKLEECNRKLFEQLGRSWSEEEFTSRWKACVAKLEHVKRVCLLLRSPCPVGPDWIEPGTLFDARLPPTKKDERCYVFTFPGFKSVLDPEVEKESIGEVLPIDWKGLPLIALAVAGVALCSLPVLSPLLLRFARR